MINRILARSCVFQELFAFYHSDCHKIEEAVDSLTDSLTTIQDLYYFLLDLIPSLTDLHAEQIERNKSRFYLRKEDLNPNMQLVRNRLTEKIRQCSEVSDKVRERGLLWRDNDTLLRSLLDEILASPFYNDYLQESSNSFTVDARFWSDTLQRVTFKNRSLDDYLSDLSIYWCDPTKVLEKVEVEDFPDLDTIDEKMDILRESLSYQTIRLVNSAVEIQKDFVVKTIRKAKDNIDLDEVLIPMFKDKEDEDFPYTLIRSSIIHKDQYRELIDLALQNWESERLADTDILILQMGLAELFTFPSISATVTLNEYIELAKTYSTSKSGSFINGLLDSILKNLRKEGKLNK